MSAYFKIPIKKHEIEKYKEIYKTDCTKALDAFAKTNQVGGTFWDSSIGSKLFDLLTSSEKLFDLSSYYDKSTLIPQLEIFLNIISFLGSFMIPWSVYILIYPNGQKLVTDLFQRPGLSSVINLFCVVYAVQTQGSFDSIFFREELIRFLPYVNIPSSIIRLLKLPFPKRFVQPTQRVLSAWYQYITVNLVSPESIRNKLSLLDANLVRIFLNSLSSSLEKFIEEKGAVKELTDTLSSINTKVIGGSTSKAVQSLLQQSIVMSPKKALSLSKSLSKSLIASSPRKVGSLGSRVLDQVLSSQSPIFLG